MTPVRILLADDHPVVLDGLVRILDRPELEIVGAVPDGQALVDAAVERQPDLILLDISMPVLGGMDAIRRLRKLGVPSKIIVLTMHSEIPYAVEALRAGASGYLLKSSFGDELMQGIREVLDGQTFIAEAIRQPVLSALEGLPGKGAIPLTPRQREVLRLLAQGLQAKEVADRLNISPKTVEFHKQQMKQLLGIQTVAELGVYAARNGILES
jgi:DNA-binding NarL/FixJ family response regulator